MTEPIQAPSEPELPPQGAVPVPPEGAPESELIAALVAALISGVAVALVAKILGRFAGLTAKVAATLIEEMYWSPLIRATAEEIATLPRDSSPATKILHQAVTQNAFRRAVYLINASRRLTPAILSGSTDRMLQAKRIEERHQEAHREAERKRTESAIRVAQAASEHGVDAKGQILLGWEATIDGRTSADCRQANGRNFNALVPPPIGYPGTVHLHCRCRPVPPYPTRKRVESVRPDHG